MSFIHSPKIVTDGLVLALDAGNTKSYPGTGTTWFDKSGRGNNGTLINGPTFDTANGGSIVFDGTNDYVDLSPYSYTNRNYHSAQIQFYPTNLNLNYGEIFQKGNRNDFTIRFFSTTGRLQFIYNTIDANSTVRVYFFITPNTLQNNRWYNAAITFNNQSRIINFYLDGILIGSQSIGPGEILRENSTELRLGNISQSGGIEHYAGRTSIVLMYNRSLNISEILQNYNATKGRFGL